jgi:AcrR family transcriptional regulator
MASRPNDAKSFETRVAKATRERMVKAATRVFAEHGYDGASVRAIVTRAAVNQAAINYHFGSKEGLYRAVLHSALQSLSSDEADGDMAPPATREEALRRFVRRQLRPMTARDERSDYVRIFSWETLRPSAAFRKFIAEEAAPVFGEATALVRRFLPAGTDERQAVLGALWLYGQCNIFVRNREQLSRPPLSLKVDERLVELLVETISGWASGGLTHAVAAR